MGIKEKDFIKIQIKIINTIQSINLFKNMGGTLAMDLLNGGIAKI